MMKSIFLLLALCGSARAGDIASKLPVVISSGSRTAGITSDNELMVTHASSVAVYNVQGSSVVVRCTDATGAIITCGSSTSGFNYVSLTIAVSGGAGEAIFSSTGTLRQCSTSVPMGAVYDLEIVSNDVDEFPVFGRAKIIGKAGLIGTRFLLGSYKMQISSASLDGAYKALCVIML